MKLLQNVLLFAAVIACANGKATSLSRGFYQEAGTDATSIAVGSKNGRMLAAYLAAGKLHFFNQETMNDNPWVAHAAIDRDGKKIDRFKEISIANDGAVFALSADATVVYQYQWPRSQAPVTEVVVVAKKEKNLGKKAPKDGVWIPLTNNDSDVCFKHISAGSSKQVWAMTDDGDVYRLQNDIFTRFELKGGLTCSWLSAGLDGTVVFITEKNRSYVFKDDKWFRFSAAPALNKIAVATQGLMCGIHYDHDDDSYELWKFEGGKWRLVSSDDDAPEQTFTHVSLNAAGSVFAINDQGKIYANGEKGVPIKFVESLVREK